MNRFSLLSGIRFAADAGVATGTAEAPAAATPTDPTPAAADPTKYDGSRLFYPGADKLAEAIAKAQEIARQNIRVVPWGSEEVKDANGNVTGTRNKPGVTWPQGAGAAIIPVAKNVERTVPKLDKDGKPTGETSKVNERQVFTVLLWPLYSLDQIASHKDGDAFLRELVFNTQANAVLTPLRRQRVDKGELDITSLPSTLDEVVEGTAGERGLYKSYNELAKPMLDKLKGLPFGRAFSHMTPQFLRQYLSSAAMAKSFSPEFEAKGFWTKVLDSFIVAAKAKGLSTEVFDQWKATRDAAEDIDLSSVDVSSLSL